MVPFAGWEMPVAVRGDPRGAPRGANARRDLRRLPHGRGRDRGARCARLPAAAALQRRLQDRDRRRPVLVPGQRGGRGDRRPLHLPARRRPLPDRHQCRQPRDRPRVAGQPQPGASTSPSATSPTATRCSPCRGRTRARIVASHAQRRAAASGCTSQVARIGGRPALVCGTGYTGEDGVELLIDPEVARGDLGRAGRRRRRPLRPRRPRHPAARGLLSPPRQRPDPRSQPDRGGARLVLQGGDRLRRLGGDRRGARRRAGREAGPVHDRGRAASRGPATRSTARRGWSAR